MADDRRSFLKKASLLGVAGWASNTAWSQLLPDQTEMAYVIENGQVFINRSFQNVTVGITQEGRFKVSKEPLKGQIYIDASNKIVSPGFIDILADNSSNPEGTYEVFEQYKVADGVTTALQLHGGHHKAGSYYRTFSKKPHHINWGVSTKVMNIRRNQKSIQ